MPVATGNAPIILFAYNRLQHLQATIEALRQNSEASSSLLYVYSDATKDANS